MNAEANANDLYPLLIADANKNFKILMPKLVECRCQRK